jgi:mono/diheme cytochrome c family protein
VRALILAGVAGLALLAATLPRVAPAQQAADAGRAVFAGKGNCFTCHGPEGRGTPIGPDLTDDVWVAFDTRPDVAQVARLTRAGVPRPARYPAPMPPMGGGRLSDQELTAVAVYVLALSEKD